MSFVALHVVAAHSSLRQHHVLFALCWQYSHMQQPCYSSICPSQFGRTTIPMMLVKVAELETQIEFESHPHGIRWYDLSYPPPSHWDHGLWLPLNNQRYPLQSVHA